MTKNTTHFGFETIESNKKAARVRNVFDSVSNKYDLMNDLMSLGLHRLWKHFTIEHASIIPGDIVLDLAGGTGDLAKDFSRAVGKDGSVILADINHAMLKEGRKRVIDNGVANNLSIIQLDAEKLPFEENTFNCVSIAFGLRNVTNKMEALKSIYKTLRPGGKILILEFSQPIEAIRSIYDWYSFKILPKIGKYIANDEDSYQYLAESIRMHPNQEEMIKMLKKAKFTNCRYFNFSGGIVALHIGYRT